MKNFTYKRTLDTKSIVIQEQKKKINKQQLIFSMLFFVLAFSFVFYLIYSVYYKRFEGYIMSSQKTISLIDDAYIINMKVNQGDMVHAGDTLFSYVFHNLLYDNINPNIFTDYESEVNTTKLKIVELQSELRQAELNRDSLLSIIKEVNKNIKIGVSTSPDLQSKEWSLYETDNKIEYIRRMINYNEEHYSKISNRTGGYSDMKRLPSSYTIEYMQNNEVIFGNALQYMIASDDFLIVSVQKRSASLAYKKDEVIVAYPYTNSRSADVHVQMIVAPDFLDELSDGDKVEIFIGGLSVGSGTISLRSSFMKTVEASKISKFSNNTEAVSVRVDIDDLSRLDIRYHIDNLPVSIKYKRNNRINRFSAWISGLL